MQGKTGFWEFGKPYEVGGTKLAGSQRLETVNPILEERSVPCTSTSLTAPFDKAAN
jgi:hypothetical protein